MKPLTESEIRDSFVNAGALDPARVPLPGLHETVWDEREYLGWRDPSLPQRGYLVFWREGRAVGLVLRASEARTRGGIAMCSLCSTTQPAEQVTMFAASRAGASGRAGNTVGTYICADLACSLLIRIGPPASAYGASHDVDARAAALEARLDAFTTRVLDSAA